jgi:hypothetical protein
MDPALAELTFTAGLASLLIATGGMMIFMLLQPTQPPQTNP